MGAEVIPLWQSRHDVLMRARFPPNGDPVEWVQFGPTGHDGPPVNNWAGRDIALHAHRAVRSGADCPTCGFPWWPKGDW